MSLDPRSEALVRMTNSYGPKQKKDTGVKSIVGGGIVGGIIGGPAGAIVGAIAGKSVHDAKKR